MKHIIALLTIIFTPVSFAGVVVIDPDNFAEDTNLTHVSSYVTIDSTEHTGVFAKSLSPDAADGYSTQGLGSKVFSYTDSASDVFASEWSYNPYSTGAPGLEITFHAPVTHFSILVAELYRDASYGDDPLWIEIYDTDNNLIDYPSDNRFNKQVLLGRIADVEEVEVYWAYHTFEWSGANLGKVIIGGDSEPTTFDRLEFTLAEVPEPSSILLMLVGLLTLVGSRVYSRNN